METSKVIYDSAMTAMYPTSLKEVKVTTFFEKTIEDDGEKKTIAVIGAHSDAETMAYRMGIRTDGMGVFLVTDNAVLIASYRDGNYYFDMEAAEMTMMANLSMERRVGFADFILTAVGIYFKDLAEQMMRD